MKKNRGLIIFFVAAFLALLLLVYFLIIPQINSNTGDEDTSDDVSEMLIDKKKGEITELYFYCADLDSDISLTYTETGTIYWRYAEDKEFPVNQTLLVQISSNICSIPISRRLSADEISIEDTGLDSPSYIVKITTGKEKYNFSIGDYNSFTGCYYVQLEDEDDILLVPIDVSNFRYTLIDLAQPDAVPSLSAENVAEYTVTTDSETKTITDSSSFGTLSSLYNAGTVDFKPDENDLINYGLDQPVASLTVKYVENKAVQDDEGSITSSGIDVEYEFNVKIGALCEGNDLLRYVLINDSLLVSTMSSETLQMIIDYEQSAE